jgi:uncharacterized protein (TIGR02466 family)
MFEKNFLIFPTVIKRCDDFLNNEECVDIINKIKNISTKEHSTLTKNKAYSSHDKFKNINKNLGKKINKKLDDIVNKYANEYGLERLIIDNSWYNIQSKNSSLKKHCHPNSIISGALYLKTDELSSKIYFHNPNPHIHFTSFKELNFTNFENISFDVKTGTLILFPSWLQHGSNFEENQSDERICFSFNTTYK